MSIIKNTLWNLFGTAGPMLIGLVSVPYIYQQIGSERLGILTIIWALIGYFSVFDFGLGRALTQKIAAIHRTSENSHLRNIAGSGVRLAWLIGLLGGLAVALIFKWVGISWLNASLGYSEQIRNSFLLACIAIPVTTMTAGLRGVIEGLQLFRAVNLYKFLLGISNFLGPIAAIWLFGAQLDAIVCSLVLARFAVLLLYFQKTQRHAPFRLFDFHFYRTGELLQFGSWMTLSNLLSPLMVVADRFLISNMLGAAVVAYYAVPSDFLVRLLVIPAALTITLFPVFSRALVENSTKAFSIYRTGIKTIVLVMAPVSLAIVFGAEIGLKLWLGEEFSERANIVTSILAIGILFNSVAQLPHALIQANGDAKTTAVIHLIEFLVYVPSLYLSLRFFGIVGAATVWTARAGLDLIVLHLFANKLQPIRHG